MAKKSKPGSGNAPAFPSVPELIVVAVPGAALRAAVTEVTSASGASTRSLNSLLKAAGAVMSPIFGSEPRVAASRAAVAAAEAASLPELSSFYSVAVEPAKMKKLAADLLNDPTVQAAYVKPPPSPPIWREDEAKPGVAPPDGEQAPTANFIARLPLLGLNLSWQPDGQALLTGATPSPDLRIGGAAFLDALTGDFTET